SDRAERERFTVARIVLEMALAEKILGGLCHNPLSTSMDSMLGSVGSPETFRALVILAGLDRGLQEGRTILSRSDGLGEHSETEVVGGGREDTWQQTAENLASLDPATHPQEHASAARIA
ncbi:unnamed protein product, partial [Ectocarpus sp. 12 AP-2014]